MQTLLKQSPLPGKPTVDKGIIVCPSTLVKNWAKELGASSGWALCTLRTVVSADHRSRPLAVKWLGEGVINPMVVDGKGGKTILIPNVRRWVAAKGRQITQQGALRPIPPHLRRPGLTPCPLPQS